MAGMTKRSKGGTGKGVAARRAGRPRVTPVEVVSGLDAPVRRADGTYVLTPAEREKVEELTGLAVQTNALVEVHVVHLGGQILQKAFDNSTEAVLQEEASPNAVWRELQRRAGGPTLRMTAEMLTLALKVAVWDKSVNDDNFKHLDIERKKLLLPLGKADLMREAAQHVLDAKLTWRATKRYVKTLRLGQGQPVRVRVSERQVGAKLGGVVERFGTAQNRQAVARMAAKLSPEKRKALASKVDEAIAALRATRGLLDG